MKLTLVLDNWGLWGPAGGVVLFNDSDEAITSAYIDTVEDIKEFLDMIDIDENCEFHVEAKAEDILSGSINGFIKECSDAFKARITEDRSACCCICGEKLDGYGNDPWPVVISDDAKCCDKCNLEVVVPARMRRLRR